MNNLYYCPNCVIKTLKQDNTIQNLCVIENFEECTETFDSDFSLYECANCDFSCYISKE